MAAKGDGGAGKEMLLPAELADDSDDLHFVPAPCQVAGVGR